MMKPMTRMTLAAAGILLTGGISTMANAQTTAGAGELEISVDGQSRVVK